jgi:hypothetical protein
MTIADRERLFVSVGGRTPGSPLPFSEKVYDEAGRLEGYRQPYVQQLVVGAEYAWRNRFKIEVVVTERQNRDLVGLRDLNIATNYTRLRNISLGNYAGRFVHNGDGSLMVIPEVYLANDDVIRFLTANGGVRGIPASLLNTLTFDQDLVFGVIPEARRTFRQGHVTFAANFSQWSLKGSVTGMRFEGNVSGITSVGGVGTSYTPGQWVRPNEALNSVGRLPGLSEFESKLWLTAKISADWAAGLTYTHFLGERYTPTLQLDPGRFQIFDNLRETEYDIELFKRVTGQTVYLEPMGNRHYGDRTTIDVRVEHKRRVMGLDWVLQGDITNLIGIQAITLVHTTLNAALVNGETLRFGQPRLRAEPRTLHLGGRVALGR